ncbi:MAG: hypothetical protein ABIE07_00600 [Candidatus Zixiibacteriota bacterium]
MYNHEHHLILIAEAERASQEYMKFIRKEPLKPGELLEPKDYEALHQAHRIKEKTNKAEKDYFYKFIDTDGRFNPNMKD